MFQADLGPRGCALKVDVIPRPLYGEAYRSLSSKVALQY